LDERKNNPFAHIRDPTAAAGKAWDPSDDDAKTDETFTDEEGNVFIKKRVERKKKRLLPW
jgi:hypothetical protein